VFRSYLHRVADLAPALAILAFHLAFLPGYGVFRDELYYIACGRRPAWGYVDHPPLVAWVAWLVVQLVGESHLVLRAISALVIALSVWLAAALGADTLLLVKSAEPPRAAKPISAEKLARLGLVDAAFPAMLRGRPVTVRILGPRDREALIRGLAEGVPPGVAVAP